MRVTFFYSFLKLDFEIGMYTEVSFFANAVILPAVIYNPINGIENLNDGSGFYYGFSLTDNPGSFELSTNMPKYGEKDGLLSFLKRPGDKDYWLSLIGKDRMMYVELKPSSRMIKDGSIPQLYLDPVSGEGLKVRDNSEILPLGKSPVNMGIYFDLTKFSDGEHFMSFRLFFENSGNTKVIDTFRNLDDWYYRLNRL